MWWPVREHGRGEGHGQVSFLSKDLLALVVAPCWVSPLIPVWLPVCSNPTSDIKWLGNFRCTPWGKLSTRLCLSIKKFNDQCIGQSPTVIRGSTGRLQRCGTSQFLTHTCTSTHHIIMTSTDFPPYLQGSLCSLVQNCSPSGIPASSLFNLVLQSDFLAW